MQSTALNAWTQAGRLWVWQYADPRHGWRGWHMASDPDGCRSIRLLLDMMQGDGACHRSVMLAPVTQTLLAGVGYGGRVAPCRDRMRICFKPEAPDVVIETQPDRLVMTVGNWFLRKLVAGFTAVEVGEGDFGLRLSDNKRADIFMFWWPPRH